MRQQVETETSYTDPQGMPEDERMRSAELRTVREWLGFSGDALASWLGVNPRTFRRWEEGTSPIPDGARRDIEDLERRTGAFITALIPKILDSPEPALITYRSNEAYHQAHPDMQAFPAAWHRRVCARIAQEVPGLVIDYADSVDEST